ncbi:MAG: ATP-binding protein [Bacteroidales bacterium]|nr:ATP-binding protein [Bacteroidales bacterium]
MKIAITSGKGGTGKTTVSTGLFHIITRYLKYNVQLLDCDVEEPDCHIFIKASENCRYPVTIAIPEIETEKCTFCGKCKSVCAYNAIIMLPPAGYIEVVEDMCHGCGACLYVCPEKAIRENIKSVGKITHYDYYVQDEFIEGRMDVGSALQTRVIRETINHAGEDGIILMDSPPGTSCPVIATASKADYVIMVTEPTPFGLYDLKLMADTVRQLGKKHGIVINKAGFDYEPLYNFINENKIPILGEIPFKREYAEAYSKGMIPADSDVELRKIFMGIINSIINGKTL